MDRKTSYFEGVGVLFDEYGGVVFWDYILVEVALVESCRAGKGYSLCSRNYVEASRIEHDTN